jgi:O-antigen ligase
MLAELRKVRFPVETGLLIAFCVFLPLVEMPKNLAWLLYVCTWAANRVLAREWGGRWDYWDTLFALWIGSAYLAAAFAGLQGSELGGAHELARYALLGWLVKRAGYGARALTWLVGALVVSTLAGLAHGYWRIVTGASASGVLQLHSVGHVNHSAIYLAIMVGVCACWLFARWHGWTNGRRAAALSICVFLLASLVVTASRGAVGVGFVMLLLLAAAWWPRTRALLGGMVAVVALSAAAVIGLNTELVRKHETFAARDNTMSSRDVIWRMSLAAWERFPWFGVGMDNYSLITYDRVQAWRVEAGKDFERARYLQQPHAHNLFFNALAERGAVGLGVLAAVLIGWLAALLRWRPRPRDGDQQWILWGGAASAWIVTVGVGLVNTTLHHEHGLLAALLLGLWLSTLPTRRAS